MKKLLTLLLASALAFTSLACNKAGDNAASAAPSTHIETNAPGGLIPPASEAGAALSGELMPGMFTLFKSVGGFKLNGVSLSAERTGTPGGINNWEPSLTKVRTVFELDEWIAYTLEYEYGNEYAKLGVWLFPHRELSEYKDISEMEGDVFFCEYELPYETYPLPIDDMFDLQTKYHAIGDYDLLLTLNGEIVAGTLLSFVENGALEGKSDDQIASLMAVG
ncbi:MAG: hypothetical protein IKZ82_10350 [Clostridia bacterium]|nr:hypothetical protein [Clostridia bacterium]